ncbi:hypothetical protein V6C27_13490 [Peptococcaceae bacterium 1198_IL3148]
MSGAAGAGFTVTFITTGKQKSTKQKTPAENEQRFFSTFISINTEDESIRKPKSFA